MKRFAFILALLVAAGCDERPKDAGISAKFFDQAKQMRQAGRMNLSALVPSDWDKVCYYSPYRAAAKLNIDNSDGDWTLVFFKADAEAARIQGTDRKLALREKGGEGDPPCFSRADAILAWEHDVAVLRKA